MASRARSTSSARSPTGGGQCAGSSREGGPPALRLQEHHASIAWSGESIEMEANSEERVKAVLDVFQFSWSSAASA